MREVPLDFADAIGSWQLPRCAGWVDGALRGAGGWTLSGWAVLPGSGPFDVIRAYWNGRAIHEAMLTERPDVAPALYWMAKSDRAGFGVALPPGEDAGRLDLVGEQRGRAVAGLATTFLAPEHETAPLPPAAMSERVSGMSGDAFRLSGLKGFTDLWDQVRRHADGASSPRVLDWGCGCGRVARYLVRAPGAEVFGCDIDGEAVAWCEENLEGHFSRTGPDPPLPYADGELDVVLAFSVFTHLRRTEQARWLAEMRRVLSPDGLLLASVAGRFAFLSNDKRRSPLGRHGSTLDGIDARLRMRRLRRAGILDDQLDDWLDGIAPPGYYRHVFQDPEYTVRTWSAQFDVLEYVARGLTGHQDLVVMRPRPAGAGRAA